MRAIIDAGLLRDYELNKTSPHRILAEAEDSFSFRDINLKATQSVKARREAVS